MRRARSCCWSDSRGWSTAGWADHRRSARALGGARFRRPRWVRRARRGEHRAGWTLAGPERADEIDGLPTTRVEKVTSEVAISTRVDSEHSNGALGIDNPFAAELRRFPGNTSYYGVSLSKNMSPFVNFIYQLRSNVLTSVEYRYLKTYQLDDEPYAAHLINISLGYIF